MTTHRKLMDSTMRKALALATALWLVPPVFAVTAEEIVRPQRDAIEQCKAARTELDRQFALRLKQHEELTAWHQSLKEALADLVAFLDQEQDRAKAVAEIFVSRAPALTVKPGNESWVPHIGWGIFGFFEKHRDDTNKAIEEADGAISRGETSFNIAGAGWQSGQTIEAILAEDAKAAAALQEQAAKGEWSINYPGLGWVNANALAGCLADNEARIAGLLDQVSKGEFSIHIVNIGWVTRNGLQAMIDGEKKALADLEATAAAGKLSINRAFFGWQTLEGVAGHLAETSKAKTDYEAAAGTTISFNVPSIGWITGDQLAEAVAAEEKALAAMLQTAGEGKYKVPSGLGWLDLNEITAALAQPNCRPKDSPSPCLPPEHRPILEDARNRVPLAVETDAEVRQAHIDLLKAYRAAIASLAEPRSAQLALDLSQWTRMQDEFDAELAEHRRNTERKLKWLEEVMANEMPGGGK